MGIFTEDYKPNVYTAANCFEGHWPVGTAAVVVAHTPEQAAELLNVILKEVHNLPGDAEPEDMQVLALIPGVRILCDGNY